MHIQVGTHVELTDHLLFGGSSKKIKNLQVVGSSVGVLVCVSVPEINGVGEFEISEEYLRKRIQAGRACIRTVQ
ncbi:MAG: hypothetical protein WC742_12895 [Gallionellaceae bacterium]|jgi:hypothetical protein